MHNHISGFKGWVVGQIDMIIYGLLTKRQVKMAGYWPSSFFACFIKFHKHVE